MPIRDMGTVLTWEYSTATPEARSGDYRFARILAENGNYYKVQHIAENGVIDEFN